MYAYEVDAKTKHDVSKRVLRELWTERNGALSTQVLQEFYVNVTRKIPRPLPKASARLIVDSYMAWCVDTTAGEISAAFAIGDSARIGFWDALIVASAIKARATRILSEDLYPGQRIAGVIIENPYAR
jgi:predicted nucleic acid-binding protein